MPDDPTPFEAARTWHRELLRRELIRRGNEAGAYYLDERISVTEVDATGVSGGPGSVTAAIGTHGGEYQVQLNAVSGEQIGWYFDTLAKDGTTDAAPETLVEIATAAANPPADAEMDISEYEEDGPRVIYRVRWVHKLDEVPIEGDYIEVLLNGKYEKPFALSRLWHTPKLGAPPEER
jgi:hypothetical protein